MNSLNRVSILITNYNKADFIQRFEENLSQLTKHEPEIIIVDDFSVDGSRELLDKFVQKFPEVSLILNHKNLGSAASRNLALQKATRDFVFFWDIDDQINIDELMHMSEHTFESFADICKGNFAILSQKSSLKPSMSPSGYLMASIADNSNNIVEDMGYWRYLYRREFLSCNGIRFLPTLDELRTNVFILDDVFFLIQVASTNGRILNSVNRPPVYLYSASKHTPQSWRNFQNQASSFAEASIVCYRHMQQNSSFSLDTAAPLLLQKSISHMNYLQLSQWKNSIVNFIKLTYLLKLDRKMQLRLTLTTLLKSIKNSISNLIHKQDS
jgi:glycosyltransferase involved in cell wall biosynthesis